MKLMDFLVLLLILFTGTLTAQEDSVIKKIQRPEMTQALMAGGAIPTGAFSQTHWLGFQAVYAWSPSLAGLFAQQRLGFLFHAGMEYYTGREEKIVTTSYRYPGYTYLHAYSGGIYHFSPAVHLSLAGGPGLGIYNGKASFNIGLNLEGIYYFRERWGLVPGFQFIHEKGSDPLWSGSLKLSYIF